MAKAESTHRCPASIGANGVEEVIELDFTSQELESFHNTCAKVRSQHRLS